MSLDTLSPLYTQEIAPLGSKELARQFAEIVNANDLQESVVGFAHMTEPILKEVAAFDDLLQHEVDEVFEEAHERQLIELNRHLDQMVEIFMQNPYEAFVVETLQLFELSHGRSETTTDARTGTSVTEFVTRDPGRTKADVYFRHHQRQDGSWKLSIEMPLRGGMYQDSALPFTIEADSRGELIVKQKTYDSHLYTDKVMPFDDSEDGFVGRDRLRRYFKDTLVASGQVYDRPTDEREQADLQAKRFLHDKHAKEDRPLPE